jgi:Fe-S-cluster containining protein
MLNPYELLRLARDRGITVEELIRDYTEEGGTILKFEGPDSACVFLGPGGCTVHSARPLVCRLYPLGRYVPPEGGEGFAVHPGHPESAGVFAASSELQPSDTIGAYLDSQIVESHIAAAAKYFELYKVIRSLEPGEDQGSDDVAEAEGPYGCHWLLADKIAESYCQEHGLPPPESAEEQMEAHIRALTAWARRRSYPPSTQQ